MLQLSQHFRLSEFTSSATADRFGIDNSLPLALLPSAIATAEMLERIRSFLSKLSGKDIPIKVSSAYRCLALNRAVGSKDSGDHPLMLAVDWTAPSFGSPYEVCLALAPQMVALKIGQMIYERPLAAHQWIHTSSRVPDKASNRIITIDGRGARPGIKE